MADDWISSSTFSNSLGASTAAALAAGAALTATAAPPPPETVKENQSENYTNA